MISPQGAVLLFGHGSRAETALVWRNRRKEKKWSAGIAAPLRRIVKFSMADCRTYDPKEKSSAAMPKGRFQTRKRRRFELLLTKFRPLPAGILLTAASWKNVVELKKTKTLHKSTKGPTGCFTDQSTRGEGGVGGGGSGGFFFLDDRGSGTTSDMRDRAR